MRFLILHLALFIAVAAADTRNSGCPDSYTLVGDQCLSFVTYTAESYHVARGFCRASSGELARITTASQFAILVNHIREIGYGGRIFWVDGSDEAEEGNWVTSSGQPVPRGTPFWGGGDNAVSQQPDNANGNENCLTIYSPMFLYLNDYPCHLEDNFICEYTGNRHGDANATAKTTSEDDGTSIILNHQLTNDQPDEGRANCPFMHVEIGGLCVLFVTWEYVPWNEAASVCGDAYELLEITDAQVLREVYLHLHQEGISDHSFWLGGSDISNEGKWIYTSGQPVPMGTPFWGIYTDLYIAQEPNGGTEENCLVLEAKGYHYFRDLPCYSTANPLCVYVG